MSNLPILVEVPLGDSDELENLSVPGPDVATGHGLDGAAIATGMITLTPGALLVLKAWLWARVEQRKNYAVIIKGRRFTGYTANEVEQIIRALEAEADGQS